MVIKLKFLNNYQIQLLGRIKTKLIEKVKQIEKQWDDFDDENKTVLKKMVGVVLDIVLRMV